jgi:spermidine/putrescine-binding protein
MVIQEPKSRREVLKATGVGVVGASLAGCVGGGDEDSVEITVTMVGGSYQEWIDEHFVQPWEEETGNTVNLNTKQRGPTLAEIRSNADNPTTDSAHMDNTEASQLGAEGLLHELDGQLSDHSDIPDSTRHPYLAGKIVTVWGIGANSDAVETEITEWGDLLNPELKGNVAIPIWEWQGFGWFHVLNNALGGSVSNIDPGLDYLETIVSENNAQMMESADHGLRLFKNEEIVAAPYFSARTDQIQAESDINSEFVYPQDGAGRFVFGMVLVNGRSEERTDATADFLNSTYDPERQAAFCNEIGYPPVNPEADQYIDDETKEAYPSISPSQEELETLGKLDIDWVEAASKRDEHAEEWRRIVS